jgi:ABC-type Mn2+/Zn2+ transport system ATPase subunit
MKTSDTGLVVGLVGPCTAGKSTLTKMLLASGIDTHHIAQEHSYVPYMWQRITNPDALIFLDVSYPVSLQRRKFSWTEEEYREQHFRLRHAREHAHLYILTDPYTPKQVFDLIMTFLKQQQDSH